MADQEDENIYALLQRRQRELKNRLNALESKVHQTRAELATIDKMIEATTSQVPDNSGIFNDKIEPLNDSQLAGIAHLTEAAITRYSSMTIKALVLEALREVGDATTGRLQEYMLDAFRRPVSADSLRPQLSRLKADDLITQSAATEGWQLTQKGLSSLKMFNSFSQRPSLRRRLIELKDEPNDTSG
jgi:hypothetical protein